MISNTEYINVVVKSMYMDFTEENKNRTINLLNSLFYNLDFRR